jgi:putative MATE family efflux protein
MRDERSRRIVEGRLGWEMARFGAPLALGMGLQTTFNLVDAYLIGRLEPEQATPALGAIGICDQLAALGTIVSYGMSVATAALVSRRQGEGDAAGMRRVAWQSLLLISGLSVAFALLAIFGARTLIFDVVGAKGQVATYSVSYLRVLVGGSFTIFLLLHLTTLLRAAGSSKTPVSMLIVANVANLLLAVVLVYGPGPAPPLFGWGTALASLLGIPRLGLMGAAWATLIARFIVLLPLFVIVVRRFELFSPSLPRKPDAVALRRIASLGWPSSAQLVVRILAMLLTHSLVARAYTTATDQSATVALGIVFRLETMALFVALGWGSAAQTFVGQNLGAGQPRRAKSSGWYASLFNSLMMVALAVVYRVWGESIVALFDDEPRVVDTARSYFAWVGWAYVGLGTGIALGSAMQGAGATRQSLALDALVAGCFQVPGSLAVVYLLGAGYTSLWLVVALTYVAFAAAYAVSYQRGGFLRTVLA